MINTEMLSDRFEISDKLSLWCEAVDTHRLDRLDEVFVSNFVFDQGKGRVLNGLDRFRALIEKNVVDSETCGRTMHNISNLVVEFAGAEAQSTANCFAVHEGKSAYAGQHLLVWLTYDDQWSRTDGGWKILRRIYRWRTWQGPVGIV